MTGHALLEEENRIWHLVRPTDEVDEGKSKRGSMKEKERTKAITEIYLTRLLSVKVIDKGSLAGTHSYNASASAVPQGSHRAALLHRAHCSSLWTTSSKACWHLGTRCHPQSSTSLISWTSRQRSMTSGTRIPSISGRPIGEALPCVPAAIAQHSPSTPLRLYLLQFTTSVLGEHPEEPSFHLRCPCP